MKPNTMKQKAKAVTQLESVRRDNVRTLIDSKWTDARSIAKAMNFTPATVWQWLSTGLGRRYISENTARLLEERLGLVPRSLDSPGFGGHAPSKSVVQRRLEDAETMTEEAIERTGVALTKEARQELTTFFSEELKRNRKVSRETADAAVRLKRRS